MRSGSTSAACEVTPVPLELGGYRLVTLDSGEQHAHADSGYNERRAECARACELLGVASLRDAAPDQAEELPIPLDRRVRHVISENARVDEAIAALGDGDFERVGELLDRSHASLRDDYEVSTPAVEAAVERLKAAGALGARIMGGGFGGHVLGLLPPDARPPEGSGRGASRCRGQRAWPPVIECGARGEVRAAISETAVAAHAPLLRVRELTVAYGPVLALDHVDVALQGGELVVLTGEPGAGKTTLVRCLAGDVTPSSGADHAPGPAGARRRRRRPSASASASCGRTSSCATTSTWRATSCSVRRRRA